MGFGTGLGMSNRSTNKHIMVTRRHKHTKPEHITYLVDDPNTPEDESKPSFFNRLKSWFRRK